ncbi:MAG: Glu/Leu/Phe/Val dehydrogenase [Deltaproteobacteria bacterium]|nr:Glu/Leu/Phe/Val dehydrogenase [Deltaproteobacteria bacterium]
MEVHSAHDSESGLRAMIAIHDTRLGPAVGGARVRAYGCEDEALEDVVRLARAMTAKAALAGLPHGGGKAVIWVDPSRPPPDRETLFRAFGRFVDTLNGRYLTCEDSGTSPTDIDVVRSVTRHCLGASKEMGGSGDPSPFTALGVRRGIEACAHVVMGRDDLQGLHVAIQGVGNVGMHLARELFDAGCRLTIADADEARALRVARETGAEIVSAGEILGVECDVLAPCALGGVISDATVDRLRCRMIAGGANNQLASKEMGQLLQDRGVFYAPDYAINAGGLINVAQEWKGYDAHEARQKTLLIYNTIAEIARRSLRTWTPPAEIAERMVEEALLRVGVPQPFASSLPIFSSPTPSFSRGTAV